MKKIMYNDKYGLTNAVLEGRKTVTRRMLPQSIYGTLTVENNPIRIDEHIYGVNSHSIKSHFPKYNVGEVIAISQAYKDCGSFDVYEAHKDTAGWNNKLFVRADLMPHHIKITNVRCERLQDISEEDCLKEGVRVHEENSNKYFVKGINEYKPSPCAISQRVGVAYEPILFSSPHEAFAALIDKVSGKDTWNSNPYVFRYEFELLK